MSGEIFEFKSLPGIIGACQRIAQDLGSRKSVIWFVPGAARLEEFSVQVRELCQNRRLTYQDISLDGAGMDRPAGTALADALSLEARNSSEAFTPGFLARQPDWPDVLELRNISRLGGEERRRWCRFIQQWVQAMRNPEQTPSPKALFVTVSSEVEGLPGSDVFLAHHRLWGHVSNLDMRLFTRPQFPGEPGIATWEEMVYPELAGVDPDVVPFLLEQSGLEGSTLSRRLAAYGVQRGWRREQIAALDAEKVIRLDFSRRIGAPTAPPVVAEQLWRIGAVYWTEEYGVELHAAAIAMIDRHDVLYHRTWRGQVRSLLPILDSVRRSLCEYLNREFPDWVTYAHPRDPWDLTTEAGIQVAEFGVLEQVGRESPSPWGLRTDFHRIVDDLRRLRNQLAHYSPLSRADYQQLTSLVRETGRFR